MNKEIYVLYKVGKGVTLSPKTFHGEQALLDEVKRLLGDDWEDEVIERLKDEVERLQAENEKLTRYTDEGIKKMCVTSGYCYGDFDNAGNEVERLNGVIDHQKLDIAWLREVHGKYDKLEAEDAAKHEALSGILCQCVEGVEFFPAHRLVKAIKHIASEGIQGRSEFLDALHRQIRELRAENKELVEEIVRLKE